MEQNNGTLQETESTRMDIKNEFAKWFSPKAPKSYTSWFGKNLDGKLDQIHEAYTASFGKSLFAIDITAIPKEIATIKNNIANRDNVPIKTFAEYDKKTSNGIPKAILGHYIRFLGNYGSKGGNGGNGETGEPPSLIGNLPAPYFSYEKDLQDTLISQAEELFPEYKIFGDDYEGIEYAINGKRIDLLLEHKTQSKLLVIELKAGPADYKTFGQISMYIGPLMQKFPDKEIDGIIIAGEIDDSLKMAILSNTKIQTMAYKMELTLEKITQ